MKIEFLLSMEDTVNGSTSRVELFSKKTAALEALNAAYAETLLRLRFDTSAYSENHYCNCNASAAIITDGEDNYSWSVGARTVLD